MTSPPPLRLRGRRPSVPALAALTCLAVAAALALRAPASAQASVFAAGRVVVRFGSREGAVAASAAGAPSSERTAVLRLRRGEGLEHALTRLRRRRDVLWAVPDYVAHTSGTF